MRLRLAACAATLAFAAVALAGCGGGGGSGGGAASIWVTRDDGRTRLVVDTAPAGLNAIQALDRVAKLTTRYGGRFVQAVDGVAGSASARRDWFLYVNGYEADRGGVEITLRAGDIAWWDFHDWSRSESLLVAGAFPEPFLHGYRGSRRDVYVLYARPTLQAAAQQIGKVVKATAVRPLAAGAPAEANVVVLREGSERFRLSFRAGTDAANRAGDPVELLVSGPAVRLAADPAAYRYRYEVGPR